MNRCKLAQAPRCPESRSPAAASSRAHQLTSRVAQCRIVNHVLETLKPFSEENGGALKISTHEYVSGRPNVLIEYNLEAAATGGTCSFVGSHLDVVPANPETWNCDPFKLTKDPDGDKLFGRGTTDCLGHVAMITDMFCTLAEKKPELKVAVIACFIASEESTAIADVGVDMLVKEGKLEHLKKGPVFWCDSADSQPCIGTAAAIQWTLKATGYLFHSGLPHKGINSLELGSEAVAELQKRFYSDFPAHEQEKVYAFATPSTMKPTQIKCAEGGVNQLPPWTEFQGDIRLTPFYNAKECQKKVEEYVADINAKLEELPTRGPCSKYAITKADGEPFKGSIELSWNGEPFKGIACKLDSPGFAALKQATGEIKGKAEPYSICGSLPLVGDMQEDGFDVQVCGFGLSSVYHGDNEYCKLSDMVDAVKILSRSLELVNESA
jgi:acetylornithine deacetylase